MAKSAMLTVNNAKMKSRCWTLAAWAWEEEYVHVLASNVRKCDLMMQIDIQIDIKIDIKTFTEGQGTRGEGTSMYVSSLLRFQ